MHYCRDRNLFLSVMLIVRINGGELVLLWKGRQQLLTLNKHWNSCPAGRGHDSRWNIGDKKYFVDTYFILCKCCLRAERVYFKKGRSKCHVFFRNSLFCSLHFTRSADKSLAWPTSGCILFDGENISFDASLVIHVNNTNIPPIMIINRIYEHQNLLSL